MFIIINYMTVGWEQWRKGHDTVREDVSETTMLFAKKAFGSQEAARKYIEEYFIGRSENYTIEWNNYGYDVSLIDAIVTEYEDEYNYEDEEVGGCNYTVNRLSIQEIDNTVVY